MGVVSGFDGALDVDGGNIGTGEGAIVDDLLDTRAGRRDLGREISEAAGPIANDRGEPGEPAIGDETAFDDAAQHIGIDVAAAEKKDNTFAGEFRELSRKTRGQRRGRRPFDDAFLELED